ncbi:uncharacterized protein LOC141680782 [Apium graveolens]|uniref:uncharacterized protein LOC141680782 n=1 Tax=Apium graveolens TaxID=4045 RepID=UPI003D79E807
MKYKLGLLKFTNGRLRFTSFFFLFQARTLTDSLALLALAATLTGDIPPNQTIYIKNLNEKVKKEERSSLARAEAERNGRNEGDDIEYSCYYTSGRLTEKSDVFSFGVILLEMITGVCNLKKQLTEFVVERKRWLEEIDRKQAELVAAQIALEEIRQQDRLLSTKNDMLIVLVPCF